MKPDTLTCDEIIHIYANSQMRSANFTEAAVHATYIAGLAALNEIDALRAKSEAAERDLAVERGCTTCWYLNHDCPEDCDCHGCRWKWRGVDGAGVAQGVEVEVVRCADCQFLGNH